MKKIRCPYCKKMFNTKENSLIKVPLKKKIEYTEPLVINKGETKRGIIQ